ncbi:MAG: chorismate synthase [Bacteroidota bacterium]|jgi:chorismate synthase
MGIGFVTLITAHHTLNMNSFGNIFRITSFGESHGAGIGVVIDGCPAGLDLDLNAIQHQLDLRRPGQSRIATQRSETDRLESLSGLSVGVTTGAPLAFLVRNEDHRPEDYGFLAQQFRPSHADYTYFAKYGIRDVRGGGRSSARETIARVIGGAVARQLLAKTCGMRFRAWVSAVGEVEEGSSLGSTGEHVSRWLSAGGEDGFSEGNCEMVRCPDPELAVQMIAAIDAARAAGDSLGGVISCSILNVPIGLGEPVYDKLHARLGYAMLGINAVKGFEIGSGFGGSRMRGTQHNDTFYTDDLGRVRTRTNHSGGIQGGISNGEDIFFRVAFKPTSTILSRQDSVDTAGSAVTVEGKGRHDPCVVPRAVPIVEAMAALVMADFWLRGRSSKFAD